VPAYRDWRKFRRSFEGGTQDPDVVASWVADRNLFVDQYGAAGEKEEIAEFWPPAFVKHCLDGFNSRETWKATPGEQQE
jgi:hypothetical protein